MGYCVDIDLRGVVFTPDKQAGALAAINALHTDEKLEEARKKRVSSGGSWGGGNDKRPVRDRIWYGFVDNPKTEAGFETLEEAISAWNFETETDDAGNLKLECFVGEKWANQDVLFYAIAPFLPEGAEIMVRGEDGNEWGYRYQKGTVFAGNVQKTIVFGDEPMADPFDVPENPWPW